MREGREFVVSFSHEWLIRYLRGSQACRVGEVDRSLSSPLITLLVVRDFALDGLLPDDGLSEDGDLGGFRVEGVDCRQASWLVEAQGAP